MIGLENVSLRTEYQRGKNTSLATVSNFIALLDILVGLITFSRFVSSSITYITCSKLYTLGVFELTITCLVVSLPFLSPSFKITSCGILDYLTQLDSHSVIGGDYPSSISSLNASFPTADNTARALTLFTAHTKTIRPHLLDSRVKTTCDVLEMLSLLDPHSLVGSDNSHSVELNFDNFGNDYLDYFPSPPISEISNISSSATGQTPPPSNYLTSSITNSRRFSGDVMPQGYCYLLLVEERYRDHLSTLGSTPMVSDITRFIDRHALPLTEQQLTLNEVIPGLYHLTAKRDTDRHFSYFSLNTCEAQSRLGVNDDRLDLYTMTYNTFSLPQVHGAIGVILLVNVEALTLLVNLSYNYSDPPPWFKLLYATLPGFSETPIVAYRLFVFELFTSAVLSLTPHLLSVVITIPYVILGLTFVIYQGLIWAILRRDVPLSDYWLIDIQASLFKHTLTFTWAIIVFCTFCRIWGTVFEALSYITGFKWVEFVETLLGLSLKDGAALYLRKREKVVLITCDGIQFATNTIRHYAMFNHFHKRPYTAVYERRHQNHVIYSFRSSNPSAEEDFDERRTMYNHFQLYDSEINARPMPSHNASPPKALVDNSLTDEDDRICSIMSSKSLLRKLHRQQVIRRNRVNHVDRRGLERKTDDADPPDSDEEDSLFVERLAKYPVELHDSWLEIVNKGRSIPHGVSECVRESPVTSFIPISFSLPDGITSVMTNDLSRVTWVKTTRAPHIIVGNADAFVSFNIGIVNSVNSCGGGKRVLLINVDSRAFHSTTGLTFIYDPRLPCSERLLELALTDRCRRHSLDNTVLDVISCHPHSCPYVFDHVIFGFDALCYTPTYMAKCAEMFGATTYDVVLSLNGSMLTRDYTFLPYLGHGVATFNGMLESQIQYGANYLDVRVAYSANNLLDVVRAEVVDSSESMFGLVDSSDRFDVRIARFKRTRVGNVGSCLTIPAGSSASIMAVGIPIMSGNISFWFFSAVLMRMVAIPSGIHTTLSARTGNAAATRHDALLLGAAYSYTFISDSVAKAVTVPMLGSIVNTSSFLMVIRSLYEHVRLLGSPKDVMVHSSIIWSVLITMSSFSAYVIKTLTGYSPVDSEEQSAYSHRLDGCYKFYGVRVVAERGHVENLPSLSRRAAVSLVYSYNLASSALLFLIEFLQYCRARVLELYNSRSNARVRSSSPSPREVTPFFENQIQFTRNDYESISIRSDVLSDVHVNDCLGATNMDHWNLHVDCNEVHMREELMGMPSDRETFDVEYNLKTRAILRQSLYGSVLKTFGVCPLGTIFVNKYHVRSFMSSVPGDADGVTKAFRDMAYKTHYVLFVEHTSRAPPGLRMFMTNASVLTAETVILVLSSEGVMSRVLLSSAHIGQNVRQVFSGVEISAGDFYVFYQLAMASSFVSTGSKYCFYKAICGADFERMINPYDTVPDYCSPLSVALNCLAHNIVILRLTKSDSTLYVPPGFARDADTKSLLVMGDHVYMVDDVTFENLCAGATLSSIYNWTTPLGMEWSHALGASSRVFKDSGFDDQLLPKSDRPCPASPVEMIGRRLELVMSLKHLSDMRDVSVKALNELMTKSMDRSKRYSEKFREASGDRMRALLECALYHNARELRLYESMALVYVTEGTFFSKANWDLTIYNASSKVFISEFNNHKDFSAAWNGRRFVSVSWSEELGAYCLITSKGVKEPVAKGVLLMCQAMEHLQDSRVCDAVDLILARDTDLEASLNAIMITMVNGVAGCGKTYSILKSAVVGKDMVVTSTKAARDEYLKIRPEAKQHYRTIDSVVLNGAVVDADSTLYVDEATMSHFGTILLASLVLGVSLVKLYGDLRQIQWICRVVDFPHRFSGMLYDDYVEQNVTYRSPKIMYKVLCKVYPELVIASNVEGRILVRKIAISSMPTISELTYGADVNSPNLVMVFTQAEKQAMSSIIHVDDPIVLLTVHEAEGQTFRNVMLVRLSQHENEIYSSPQHLLVAMTRHKENLTYFSPLISDDISSALTEGLASANDAIAKERATMRCLPIDPCVPPVRTIRTAQFSTLQNFAHFIVGYILRLLFMIDVGPPRWEIVVHTPAVPLTRSRPRNVSVDDVQLTLNELYDPVDTFKDMAADIQNVNWGIFSKINYVLLSLDAGKTSETYLTPVLMTQQPARIEPTYYNVSHALLSRNVNPPLITDERASVFIDQCVANFAEIFLNLSRLEANKRSGEYVGCAQPLLASWIADRTPTQMSGLNHACENPEINRNNYASSAKPDAKPKLDNSGARSIPASQIITAQNPLLTAELAATIKSVTALLKASLKDKWLIADGYSDEELSGHVNFILTGVKETVKLEIDFSKFDKSQEGMLLLIVTKILVVFLDMPIDMAKRYVEDHVINTLAFRSLGVHLRTRFQRRSGDILTLLGNTLVSMVVIAFAYDLGNSYGGVFVGDDSLVFLTPDASKEPRTEFIAKAFNLVSKPVSMHQAPMFASRFLICVGGCYRFVTDPLKAITRLGRRDLYCRDHVRLLYISYKDNLSTYMDAEVRLLVAAAATIRYSKVLGIKYPQAMCIVDFLAGLLYNERAFLGLFTGSHYQLTRKMPSTLRDKIEKGMYFSQSSESFSDSNDE